MNQSNVTTQVLAVGQLLISYVAQISHQPQQWQVRHGTDILNEHRLGMCSRDVLACLAALAVDQGQSLVRRPALRHKVRALRFFS